jgi:predicted kinase
MPLVVLVNGISATGKTTVARELASRLRLPLFAKDAVKERLFDTVGYSDREWAHRLSGATHAVLNYVMEEELRCGRGFIVEANFNPSFDAKKFSRWQALYGASLVQVLCYAEGEVVFERFRRRVESGERHPGHCDGGSVEAWRGYLMAGKCAPLAVEGRVIEVDTTDFSALDYDTLAQEIAGLSRE